jgi:4-hydroxy-tetrahydrodipicolinate reductase
MEQVIQDARAAAKSRILLHGVGEIGRGVARLLRRRGYPIVGAVDVAPELVGADLGAVIGEGALSVRITDDVEHSVRRGVDVTIHATSWTSLDFHALAAQLRPLIRAGSHVISLSGIFDPSRVAPDFAQEIDELARHHGVTVLGIGLNPGFLLDVAPLLFTGLCEEVTQVQGVRVADCSMWGPVLLQRYGIGLGEAEFREAVASGTLALHVTVEQSVALIAHGLGWSLDEVVHEREPIAAHRERKGQHAHVGPGGVVGFRHVARGRVQNRDAIVLEMAGALGPNLEEDGIMPGTRFTIVGTPGLTVEIGGELLTKEGAYLATCARSVNAIPFVLRGPRGFVRVLDLPLITAS